jgi:hypothetical protein
MMQISYPEIGICGLSCRLCPRYHTKGTSRCDGCKGRFRMGAGCPFITCAVKKKGIEFCWQCKENEACERWAKRREWGRYHDSFTCYQTLEDNIAFIQRNGITKFRASQRIREKLLREMISSFNEGRSKTYYCIAAAVLKIEELKAALAKARTQSADLDTKGKSMVLHALLDNVAERKQIRLTLRK